MKLTLLKFIARLLSGRHYTLVVFKRFPVVSDHYRIVSDFYEEQMALFDARV